jgi:hypothetical protein
LEESKALGDIRSDGLLHVLLPEPAQMAVRAFSHEHRDRRNAFLLHLVVLEEVQIEGRIPDRLGGNPVRRGHLSHRARINLITDAGEERFLCRLFS